MRCAYVALIVLANVFSIIANGLNPGVSVVRIVWLSYNPTSHKATTIKILTRRAQLVCDTPDSLRDENKYLEPVFHKNNYNADFIRRNIYDLPKLTQRTGTRHLLLKWLYLILRALLRPSHGSYSPTTSVLPTNLQLRYDTYWPTLKTGTNPTTDREQFARSNAPTAKLPTSVRLAETWTRDWLNTNEPLEMVMSTITLLYIINWQTTTLTGTLLNLQYELFSTTDSWKLVH